VGEGGREEGGGARCVAERSGEGGREGAERSGEGRGDWRAERTRSRGGEATGLSADCGAGEEARRLGEPLIYAGVGRGEAGRRQAGLLAGRLNCSRQCRAGPRAWGKAQARPASPGQASPGLLASMTGRAWSLGCMANYGGSSKDKDGICGGHRQQHKRGKLGCHVAIAILVVFVLQEKAGSTATTVLKN